MVILNRFIPHLFFNHYPSFLSELRIATNGKMHRSLGGWVKLKFVINIIRHIFSYFFIVYIHSAIFFARNKSTRVKNLNRNYGSNCVFVRKKWIHVYGVFRLRVFWKGHTFVHTEFIPLWLTRLKLDMYKICENGIVVGGRDGIGGRGGLSHVC